ncbi:WG containing repeat-containing protein [Chitinophaga jiangningensis]|uniref:WG containing repeat-containing protein n=1 Tax=Chitinophaga jiangningensis TaxID=1419482 RepID=A0A1M7C5Q6_9BACT|nr:WG repeat-containing protein [Chitinophaga jiangningensis]SHL62551.1 WG containing repeat-containing protein [Chitinophaga jiangningensis]
MIKYLIVATLLWCTTVQAQQGSAFVGGLARIEQDGKSWYINTRGEKVFDRILSQVKNGEEEANALQVIALNGKMGVIDAEQRIVVKPEYDQVEAKWNQYLELKKGNKVNLADKQGTQLFPWQFEEINYLDGNNFDVRAGKLWGIYNLEAKRLIIPLAYEGFDYCGGCGRKGDYLFAKKNGKWGIINFNNETLLPFEYDHEHYYMRSDNWVRSLKRGDKEVVINLDTKKEYHGPDYTDMDVLSAGMLKARHNGLFGLIDAAGKQVADFVYTDIYSPYDERYAGELIGVVKDGKHGIILPSGKVVLPPKYESEIHCIESFMIVQEEGMYQLLDSTGRPLLDKHYTAIAPKYVGRDNQRQLIFMLKQQAVDGFYNPRTGKTAAPAFYELDPTSDGTKAIVEHQGQYGLYSISGENILPIAYSEIEELTPDLFTVAGEDNKRGLYDVPNKKMQIQPAFRNITQLPGSGDDFLVIMNHEDASYRYGIYDKTYKQLLPADYTDIICIGQDGYLLKQLQGDSVIYSLYNLRTNKLQPLKCLYAYQVEVPGQLQLTDSNESGIIDANGNMVIPMAKQMIHPLKNKTYQVIRAQQDGTFKYGYTDSTGKMIVPVIYDYSGNDADFEGDGLLLVRDDREVGRSKVGLASTQGLIRLPVAYNAIMQGDPGPGYIVMKGEQFQLLGPDGQPVVPTLFDDVALAKVTFRNATLVSFSWPVLTRTGKVYQYINADGTTLPVRLTGVADFEPSYGY